jgi:plasmid maintenance system antidote protein VapI
MDEKEARPDVLSRLMNFVKSTGLTTNAFISRIGMGSTTVFNQINGKRALSLDTVLNSLTNFGDLSAEWLLRGQGEMRLSERIDNSENTTVKYEGRIGALIDTITLLQETIKTKNATIDALQAELSQYKNKSKKA